MKVVSSLLYPKSITRGYLFLIFLLLIFSGACNMFSSGDKETPKEDEGFLPADERKYELKSAIITLKGEKQVLGSDIISVVYIDDYGEKYCNITDTRLKLKNAEVVTRSISITKNNVTYTYNPEKSTGTKNKNKGNFNPIHVDFARMDEQTLAANGIRREGFSEILGKPCEVFVVENEALEMKGRYEVWNKIPLRLVTEIGPSQMSMIATDLKENIAIDPAVFEIPDSIVFTDAANPITSPGESFLSDSQLNLPVPGK